MNHSILVTGATGNVGSEVLRHLAAVDVDSYAAITARRVETDDAGHRPRPTAETSALIHGAQPRVFDFTEESTWQPALTGIDAVFLVRPPHISNIARDMEPFLRYLAGTEVRHVVFLSVLGAEANRMVPHHKVERALERLGIAATMLRPSFFMQNLTTTHLTEIRDEGRIFVPAGDGRTNFVDVRDVAEAAAAILVEPEDERMETAIVGYPITGEASYTYTEVAELISSLTDTQVGYEPARLAPFMRYHHRRGRSLGHILVMFALYSVTRIGRADTTTDCLARLLGRPPRSLEAFITDHRELFLADDAARRTLP